MRRRLLAPTTRLFDDVLREVREFAANHQFDYDVCLVGVDYAGATTGTVSG